jgi:hypothetical protein
LIKKTLLYGCENSAVSPFNNTVGLWMVDGSKTELCFDHVTVFSEILAIKLLSVINCELSRDTESTNDLLLEEFSDCGGSDGGDGSSLNPLGEILKCYNCEHVTALSHGQWSNNVHAPMLQQPSRCDELRKIPWLSLVFCRELTRFTCFDYPVSIFDYRRPIETLLESFSC